MQNVNEIDELIKIISKLPGLGPKSAKRIVLKLINNKDELVKPMANILVQIYKNVTRCNSCGSLKSNLQDCVNCVNPKGNFKKICVVEDIADQWSIENSNIFQGYFHILGGTISSSTQRKEDLLINSLVERVKRDDIEEVILATSATVEGQTTGDEGVWFASAEDEKFKRINRITAVCNTPIVGFTLAFILVWIP